MYCFNCGKEVEDDASFCPYCGMCLKDEKVAGDSIDAKENDCNKNKIEQNQNKIIESQDLENTFDSQIENNDKICENEKSELNSEESLCPCDDKGDVNPKISSNEPEVGNDPKRKIMMALFLVMMIFLAVNSGPTSIEETNEILKNKALENPELYWSFDFADPYPNDECIDCYILTPAYEEGIGDIDGQYCLVMGVTSYKDKYTSYYLTDDEDGGTITVNIDDFTINNFIHPTKLSDSKGCGYFEGEIDILNESQIISHEGDTYYLLFELDEKDLKLDMYPEFRGNYITSLRYEQ